MNEERYQAKVMYASKELSKKEVVALTLASGDTEVLDQIAPIDIDVDYIAVLDIFNPYVRPDTETGEIRKNYSSLIIVAKDGTKYSSSSSFLTETVKNIVEDMEDEEDWKIRVMKRKSKKNTGMFLTATIV